MMMLCKEVVIVLQVIFTLKSHCRCNGDIDVDVIAIVVTVVLRVGM